MTAVLAFRGTGDPSRIIVPAVVIPVVSVIASLADTPPSVIVTGTETTRSPMFVIGTLKTVGKASVPATPSTVKLRGGTALMSNCAAPACVSGMYLMKNWSEGPGGAAVTEIPPSGASISMGSNAHVLWQTGTTWAVATAAANRMGSANSAPRHTDMRATLRTDAPGSKYERAQRPFSEPTYAIRSQSARGSSIADA